MATDMGRERFQGHGLLGRSPWHRVSRRPSEGRAKSSFEILGLSLTFQAGKPAKRRGHWGQFLYEWPYCLPPRAKLQTSLHIHCPLGPQPTVTQGGCPRLDWVRGPPFFLAHLFLSMGQTSLLGPGTPQSPQGFSEISLLKKPPERRYLGSHLGQSLVSNPTSPKASHTEPTGWKALLRSYLLPGPQPTGALHSKPELLSGSSCPVSEGFGAPQSFWSSPPPLEFSVVTKL